jgi:hypothetical protein
MNWKIITVIAAFLVVLQLGFALTYYYSPMNFEPETTTNHTFTMTNPGTISVTLPTNFSLVSGSLSGVGSVSFIFSSPNITSNDSTIFYGKIYVNSVFQENFPLLLIKDENIVDVKVELGHGDFNYVDPVSVIGTDKTLVFSIVRLWGVGTDLLGEVASNVRFNCSYPNIFPSTVDSKYSTTYGANNISASGFLDRMEGTSLFRIFVLSQEVELLDGEDYVVTCDRVYYDFLHTNVVADIMDVNLSADSLSPFVISKVDGDGVVLYSILNNGSYDTRDLEFLFVTAEGTIREELGELRSGETVTYSVLTNESGSMLANARFVPEWMFNSRSPSYYEQQSFVTYQTTNPFYNLNASLYFVNHTMITTDVLETTQLQFMINFLQSPIYGQEYLIKYEFYADDGLGELVATQLVQVQGNGSKTIVYTVPNVPISGVEEDFEVIASISMKDVNDEWWQFSQESLGTLTIGKLTSNAPGGNPPLLSSPGVTVENQVTGNIIKEGFGNMSSYYWVLVIFIIFLVFLAVGLVNKNKRRKKSSQKQQSTYSS